MKALEKARERRYASVSDLAADIQNHLEHRPVLASPPGRLYRTRKFLRRHRAAALGTAAGLVIPLVDRGDGLVVLRDSPTRPTLTEKDTIVLADFTNKTGDPVFDDTLRQGLSVRASTIAVLAVISDRKVQQTLALMGQPKDARLTPEIAQQICERTGKCGCPGRLDRHVLAANMSWACAPGTAAPEASSISSRSRRRGKRTS